MPLQSKAQNRWAHTPEGTKALGGPDKVKEWERATDFSHLPERKGYAKGGLVSAAEYASGGPVRKDTVDKHYKTPTRTKLGQFLSTEDRFTSGRKPAGYPEEAQTDETWSKPKGIGQTDEDDCGDGKSLPPVVPNKAGHVSYAKK